MKLEGLKKIAIFRALQIGDMLCSIPAVRALRQAYPGAEIVLVGLPWAKMLVERFPNYFNSLIPFPGFPGLPEQSVNHLAIPTFLQEIQRSNFDLALQMQGSGIISNPLVELFAANKMAGFFQSGNYCPDPQLFIEYPRSVHEIHRHLQLMNLLQIDAGSTDLEFPVTARDEEDFEKAALPVVRNEYVVVHPGARGANRQWHPANFAAIGDYCFENGLQVVITGTIEEQEIVARVENLMKHRAINAAGKTSLGAAAVLIRNAAALVSNCTGVSHIAAALKTKSIVISLDGEPYRWGPLNKKLHKTIDWTREQHIELVKAETQRLLFNSIEA
jgi:ADP-heptose:LPS heptosyltransferase